MSKKDLVIALQDAGVATAIMDALPLLAEQYNLFIFAKDSMAYKKLSTNFSSEELASWNVISQNEMSIMQACLMLKKIQPAAVVCSLSDATKKVKSADGIFRLENKIDGAMVTAAQRLGIRSIGIMESVFMAKPLVQVRLNRSKANPDKLITATELMKKSLLDLGLYNKEQIAVLPMPKYAHAVSLQNNPKREEHGLWLREINGIKEQNAVVIYCTSADPEQDFAAVSLLAEAVKEIPQVEVRFTFHPKDDIDRRNLYVSLIEGAAFLDAKEMTDLEAVSCLARTNKGVLMGIKSSLLFDVLQAGGNVVSINPNQLPNNRSATAQLGLAAELVTTSGIKRNVINMQAGRFRKGNELPPMLQDVGAVENFTRALNEILTASH